MFKKSSKRNLRQRKISEDDKNCNSGESDTGTDIVNVATLKAERNVRRQKKKNKNKENPVAANSGSQAILSFGGDEEEGEDVFQLKKSSRSRKIAKHIKKITQEEREQSYNKGTTVYTKETLEELKALTVQPPNFDKYAVVDGADDNDNSNSFGNATNERYTDLRPGEIPDANRIHAARKQREMMRKYGAEYIPVENSSNSKAIREQDQAADSSDDEGPTVEMKGIINDAVRVANEIGSEGESALNRDNEFDLWEAEMIKKGISTQQFSARGEDAESAAVVNENIVQNTTHELNGMKTYDGNYQAKPSLPQTSMVPSEVIGTVRKRISERLDALRQVCHTHKQDFERASNDIEDSESSAQKMSDLTSMSSQYTYYQDMKAYVMDLLDCLGEKSAEILALENLRHKIWKERADMIVSRRQQDVKDESFDITQSLSSNKQVSNSQDWQKQMRAREREARRSRRRSARESAGKQKSHIDGMSTDDEETSMDNVKWMTELERIEKLKGELFDDVIEEFCDVGVILSKFTDWKQKHPDSYNDAYIGLCLPKLLTPFLKLAMLHWNPLEPNCEPIEQMRWYRDLLFYGVKKEKDVIGEVESRLDPDNKLLSGLFDKVVVPKLVFFIADIWDPLSRSQSHRLSMALCRAIRVYPCMRDENRRCNELLVALCARIQQAVDSDAFVPLYPMPALMDISFGPGAFFERQTWSCIKMFENALLFNGILSRDTLTELAFTLLLNRYVMLSLQMSPVTSLLVHKCVRIADAIPTGWLNDCEYLSDHLEPFSRFLLHIAKHIHNQLPSCVGADAHRARNCIAQLGKILSNVGSYEMCQDVAELLGVKV